MTLRSLALALPVCLALAPLAQAQSPAMSASETKAAIQRAGDLGQALYDRDRAAWVATDAMLAALGNDSAGRVGGWVVTPLNGKTGRRSEFRVAFHDRSEPPQVFWQGRVEGHRVAETELLDAPRPLSADETARRAALDAAIAHPDLKPCRDFLPMNHVVMTAPEGGFHVYLLSATRQPDLAVFGRHFRFTTTPDGATITASRAFTNSCIGVPMATELPEGATPAALTISHVLDPTPQETHVFVSLSHGLPVYVVMTETDALYEVDGTRMRRVKR